jgi:hypothetical protein
MTNTLAYYIVIVISQKNVYSLGPGVVVLGGYRTFEEENINKGPS